MNRLQLVCARCGFQAFVENVTESGGWQHATAVTRSLCPACQVDEKGAAGSRFVTPFATTGVARSDSNLVSSNAK